MPEEATLRDFLYSQAAASLERPEYTTFAITGIKPNTFLMQASSELVRVPERLGMPERLACRSGWRAGAAGVPADGKWIEVRYACDLDIADNHETLHCVVACMELQPFSISAQEVS